MKSKSLIFQIKMIDITLSLMIRYGLISESSIMELSSVNKRINREYKKYYDKIPKLTIYSRDIADIFKQEAIIKYHKHQRDIKWYVTQNTGSIYNAVLSWYSNVTNKYLLGQCVELFLTPIFPDLLAYLIPEMLTNKNIVGAVRLGQIILSTRNLRLTRFTPDFFALFSETHWTNIRSPKFGLLRYFYPDQNGLYLKFFIVLYEKYSNIESVYHNQDNFNLLFETALELNTYEYVVRLMTQSHYKSFTININRNTYDKIRPSIQELIHNVTFECAPIYIDLFGEKRTTPLESARISIQYEYNNWDDYLFCRDDPLSVVEWFECSKNKRILSDICLNHFDCIHLDKYGSSHVSVYHFRNVALLELMVHQAKFSYIGNILREFADDGVLEITYLNAWHSIIVNSRRFHDQKIKACLTECFFVTLDHDMTHERRKLLDRLLELGAQLPWSTSVSVKVKDYLTVFDIDKLNYFLDKGLKFTYDDVCQLYLSLNQECQTPPKNFRNVVGRMRGTYL